MRINIQKQIAIRKLIVIWSIFTLIAGGCGQAPNKQTGVATNEIVSSKQEENDSTIQEEYNNNSVGNEEKNFRQIALEEKIGNRTLKEYLLDEKIPQTFKDVFQQKQKLTDDEKTFALIDSIFSSDKERHPFYFVLVTRTMWWSDGAFSEPLGMAARKYVENSTQKFLAYFSTELTLTSFDFERWAIYTLHEILIDTDENIKELENTRILMKKNCKECSPENIKMIDKFIECMYAEYNEIQRRNKEWEMKNL